MCLSVQEIHEIMATLANQMIPIRPYFCSEGDFQAQLIHEIQKKYPDLICLSEYPSKLKDKDKYIYTDVRIIKPDSKDECLIELKYKTKESDFSEESRLGKLQYHQAQDLSRIAFLNDIRRLEDSSALNKYAIFLTNDERYWTPSQKKSTFDANYRLHQYDSQNNQRKISGRLEWGRTEIQGWLDVLGVPVTLKGYYSLIWRNFTKAPLPLFEYLLIEVQ
jgi:hypothetical protein